MIRRPRLGFEDGFVMIPNQWARDMRVRPSSKGLLVWLMSHSEGFETGVEHIAREHGVGRDAARSMVKELETQGYLERELVRGDSGKFEATDWRLTDPFEAARDQLDGLAITDQNPRSRPAPEKPSPVHPSPVHPSPVNPTTKEEHLQEEPLTNISTTYDRKQARETPGQAVARAVRAAAEAEAQHQPMKRPDFSKPANPTRPGFTAPPAPYVPRFDSSMIPPRPEHVSDAQQAMNRDAERHLCPSGFGDGQSAHHWCPPTGDGCVRCGDTSTNILDRWEEQA